MSNFDDWQLAKKNLKEARDWLSNKDKIDSQDKQPYKFVPTHSVEMQFCGQSSAGANNYHKSPSVLNRYIAKVLDRKHSEIIDEAIAMMELRKNSLAIDAKAEVDEMLTEIKDASNADHTPF